MTILETLEQEAYDLGIHLDERLLAEGDPVDGLYIRAKDGTCIILINRHRPESTRAAVLAEEIGHYHTACGNIIDQRSVISRKIELRGRKHAYRRLVPKDAIGDLIQSGTRAFYDIAEELSLPEDFVREAYAYYSVAG